MTLPLKPAVLAALFYFFIISLYATYITWLDKRHAIQKKTRVSEKRLFTTAILGGAVAMYVVMLFIRHKTKHKRFMIGLPVIIIMQAFLLLLAIRSICTTLPTSMYVIF